MGLKTKMALRRHIDRALRSLEKPFAVYNRIEVSGNALRHNAELFARIGNVPVIPVLKGNAYGHGIELATRSLKSLKNSTNSTNSMLGSFPYIAVDGYFEAMQVRHFSRRPVLIMGAILPENFARMHFADFAFAVQHMDTIEALAVTRRKVKVHLEVNTGMNRYGVQPGEVGALARHILSHKNLELEGVMSHLADADGSDAQTVADAVRLFDEAVETVRSAGVHPKWCHVAQTAGAAVAESRYANAMRLGIGLYGINPFGSGHPAYGKLSGLQPALRLISTITNVIELQPGDRVSYNYTFTAPRAMRIGVLPLGYYEGVNRSLSNKGVVKAGGVYCPIVGRVCMNHTTIDLTGTSAAVGSEVLVYSNDRADRNSIDAIAAEHGLFNYNLLTALSPDVRRVLVD